MLYSAGYGTAAVGYGQRQSCRTKERTYIEVGGGTGITCSRKSALSVPPAFYDIIIALDFFPWVSLFIFREDFLLPRK